MPSRLIDYENLWTSTKLGRLPREEDREAFLWIFGMADGHEGVFEADPLLIWQKTCAYLRPSHSPATIGRLLDELERVKLLFRFQWKGKTLGHWVGIKRPGRLPPPSKMKRSPSKYPGPPQDLLEAFLSEGTAPEDGPLFANRKIVVEGYSAGTMMVATKPPDGYRVGTRGDLRGDLEERRGVGVGGVRAETRPATEEREVFPAPPSSWPLPSLRSGCAAPPPAGPEIGDPKTKKRDDIFF